MWPMRESSHMETPNQFLCRMAGERVRVVLKWGTVYEGEYVCTDRYMNLVLKSAVEIRDGGREDVGDTCIRCNNIKIVEEMV